MGREALRHEDMDVTGNLFGIRFTEGEHKQAELYIEDDGWYHFKASFSVLWLPDLHKVAASARDALTK